MNQTFRRYYIAFHAFPRSIYMISLRNQENKTKMKDKLIAVFLFIQLSFVATLSDWYQDWVKVGLACYQTC